MEGGQHGRSGNNVQPPVKMEQPSAAENVTTLRLCMVGRIAAGQGKKPRHVTPEKLVQVYTDNN
jgi:hypothetical protein